VVGYGAVALLKEPSAGDINENAFSLTWPEQNALLQIARKSVEQAVKQHKRYEPAPPKEEALSQDRGVFVTVTSHGHLRGCIGYVSPIEPLYLAVRDAAALAAINDPRFPAVTPAELTELDYEISVLSPMRHVRDIREVRIGKDGLLVRSGRDEGVLLPQVAVDEHWDRSTFVEQACRKAGLPNDAWLRAETDVFRFTALVFGRHEPIQALLPVDPFSKSLLAPLLPASDSRWPTAPQF